MTNFLPKYFTNKAITLYFILLSLISVIFLSRVLPFAWIFTGAITVVAFFYYSNKISKKWVVLSDTVFIKKLFRTSLAIRICYVLFSYVFYNAFTGEPFEFAAGDSQGYHALANWIQYLFSNNRLQEYFAYAKDNYSDMGYPMYLGFLYTLIGDNLLMPRLLKAVIGAFTCLLVYKIGKRSFEESAGRIAGILAMLSPSLIYYCGLHLKETEMVFLTVAFVERADFVLRSKTISLIDIFVVSLLGLSLFFLRTVLGVSAFFALFTAVVFGSSRVLKFNKKVVLILWGTSLALLLLGSSIQENINQYYDDSSDNQTIGMEYRSSRDGGNKLAKYGSAAIFAPIILIAPFPTMINVKNQQNQMLSHGNYYVKNILVFFVLFAIYMLYKGKNIRRHSLILTMLITYLGILAMSTFALSERFHLPVLPFIIILAAHGITRLNPRHKNIYLLYLIFVSVLIVGWNWFKVAGRA